ncbi:MAG: FCD domain-containing protein [Candidatus Rokubacteria bacterium]|nr:FCD domain-containing protein [Candidatus Rokubacteria bacterium]
MRASLTALTARQWQRRARVICEEHLAILGALEAGDSARAESLMRGHLRQIQTETVGGNP